MSRSFQSGSSSDDVMTHTRTLSGPQRNAVPALQPDAAAIFVDHTEAVLRSNAEAIPACQCATISSKAGGVSVSSGGYSIARFTKPAAGKIVKKACSLSFKRSGPSFVLPPPNTTPASQHLSGSYFCMGPQPFGFEGPGAPVRVMERRTRDGEQTLLLQPMIGNRKRVWLW
jgi:hypothetical protein